MSSPQRRLAIRLHGLPPRLKNGPHFGDSAAKVAMQLLRESGIAASGGAREQARENWTGWISGVSA